MYVPVQYTRWRSHPTLIHPPGGHITLGPDGPYGSINGDIHMATLQATTSSVLDAVTQAAGTVSSTLGAVNTVARTLDDWTKTQRYVVQEHNVMRLANLGTEVKEKSAMRTLERRKEIKEIIGNDESLQKAFDLALNETEAAFAAARTKLGYN